MNVLICVWSIQIGGAETFAVDLCAYLRNKGYKPYLFPVLSNWDKKFYSIIKSKNIQVVSPFTNLVLDWLAWKVNRLSKIFGLPDFRNRITELYFTRLLKKKGIQVILSNSLIADSFVNNNLHFNIPFIVIEHGEYSYSVFDNTPLSLTALQSANAVVSVSKWCQEILEKQFGIRSSLIYNGLVQECTDQLLNRKSPSKFLFCMIGRGTAYKGWEEAIKAFLKVQVIQPNCELELIGDGEALEILKKKFGHYKDIHFVGKVVNPLDHLVNADVGLVLSRKYEAFGLVLLNFFLLAKPVIATKVGAIQEVVNLDNNPAGILINVDELGKAQENELIAAMITLYENEIKRKEYGRRAQQIADYFSFEKTGLAYETLITKVIAQYNHG